MRLTKRQIEFLRFHDPLYTWRQIRANVEQIDVHNPSTVGGGADAICRGDGCQRAAAAGGAGGRRGARRT